MAVGTFKPIARLLAKVASPAHLPLLIASTDVRTSNSAAMYLAVASYVSNGERVVENAAQGDKVVDEVAPLSLGQGFSEYSSQGRWLRWLSTIATGTDWPAGELPRPDPADDAVSP